MKTSFDNTIDRIVEVVMFENWLRFYFIAESEDSEDLMILIPDQAMAKIRSLYPGLADLAERLNNALITHDSSMREVCLFVASAIKASDEMLQKAFSSNQFQMEAQLFNSWLQAHEAQLDAGFADFNSWQTMFGQWKQTPKVQEYINSIEEKLQRTATDGTSEPQ